MTLNGFIFGGALFGVVFVIARNLTLYAINYFNGKLEVAIRREIKRLEDYKKIQLEGRLLINFDDHPKDVQNQITSNMERMIAAQKEMCEYLTTRHITSKGDRETEEELLFEYVAEYNDLCEIYKRITRT